MLPEEDWTTVAAAQRAAQGRAFLRHGSAHIALHNVRHKAARCCPSAACMVCQRWRTTALICVRPAASGRPPCAASAHSCARWGASMRGGAAAVSTQILFFVAAVDRQSGPRPEIRFLRHPALEGLTNSAWTETTRRGDRNKSDHAKNRATVAAGGGDGRSAAA
ncbi:rab9 effector protein with kelch motif-like [Dorcoceras hygrometricum]|uniref:Rab9 effector protein with kelch motif-like n=1 Tax=Dorcoceras hygrometricum TaxID=472368 RepID=A0A2Z7CFI7_9LAMI|nr:rab9 effector protein with kelch motif-like [Dorcoceras hygrometricum]